MKDNPDMHPPPWKELLYDFTQETTLHGIRFPTTKHTHNVRRIIWSMVILTAISVLLFIIFNNLAKFLKHPKSVNVDVTYEPELPFPAVTLCNQNLFKSTGIFKQGMHDVLTNFFSMSDNSGKCRETYTYENDYCPSIDTLRMDGNHHHLYANVSFQVCSHLCSDAHSATCTVVVYDRQHKACLLTSGKMDAMSPSCHTSPYELYRRHRCTGKGRELMTCDLEGTGTEDDDTGCNLIIDRQNEEVWSIMKVADVPNKHIRQDHTFNSALGRVLALGKTSTRPSFHALLSVDHRFYDNMCMEFWYVQLVEGENSHVHFKVIMSLEHLHEQVLLDSEDHLNGHYKRWNKVFLKLPNEQYSLKITTLRPKSADPLESGLLIDDISIWPCERYNRDCIWSADKSSYNGSNEYTEKKNRCAPWSDVALKLNWTEGLTPIQMKITEQFVAASGRSCRVPPHFLAEDARIPQNEPGCYKPLKVGDYDIVYDTYEVCEVTYCPCRIGQFHCEKSGLCIPDHLACNGVIDCPDYQGSDDASDEAATKCRPERNLTCSFEEAYMCGYTSSSFYPIQWRRKEAGNKLNEAIDVSYTHDLSSLKYILDIDGSTSNDGDKALLVSPEWTITEPGFCIWFWYHMVYHKMDTEEMLKVYVVTSVLDTIPLLTIRESNTKKQWKHVSAPLPIGTFTVMFEATIGFSYRSDISLDDIEVLKCTSPLLSPVRKKRSVQSSISCNFDTPDLCGYKLDGSSTFANWQKVPIIAAVPSSSKASCNTEFLATRGSFQTLKFPEFYPKQKCTNTFKAQESATIRISFQKIHVGTRESLDTEIAGEYDCPDDKITVTGAVQVSSGNSTAHLNSTTTTICGEHLDPDEVFVSVGSEMTVTFTALSVSSLYEGFRANYEISEPLFNSVDYILMVDRSLAGRGHQEVRLTSPRFEPLPTASCLNLKVYRGPVQMTGYQYDEAIYIFNTNVKMPDGWVMLQVYVPEDVERIVIISSQDKTAINDIVYNSEGCPVPQVPDIEVNEHYMCNFTNNDCNFKDTASHRGKWLRTLKKKTDKNDQDLDDVYYRYENDDEYEYEDDEDDYGYNYDENDEYSYNDDYYSNYNGDDDRYSYNDGSEEENGQDNNNENNTDSDANEDYDYDDNEDFDYEEYGEDDENGETDGDYAENIGVTDDTITHPDDSITHPDDTVTHPDDTVTHPDDTVTHPDDSVTHPDDTVTHPDDSVTHPDDNNGVTEPDDNNGITDPDDSDTDPDDSVTDPDDSDTDPDDSVTDPDDSVTDPDDSDTDPDDNNGVTEPYDNNGVTEPDDSDTDPDDSDYNYDTTIDEYGDSYNTEEPEKRRKRAVRNSIQRKKSKGKQKGINKKTKRMGLHKMEQKVHGQGIRKEVQSQGRKLRPGSRPRRFKRAVDDYNYNFDYLDNSIEAPSHVLACDSADINSYPCELLSPWIYTETEHMCMAITMRAAGAFTIYIITELRADFDNGYTFDDYLLEEIGYDLPSWDWGLLHIPIPIDGARVRLTTAKAATDITRLEIGLVKISPVHDCFISDYMQDGNDQYEDQETANYGQDTSDADANNEEDDNGVGEYEDSVEYEYNNDEESRSNDTRPSDNSTEEYEYSEEYENLNEYNNEEQSRSNDTMSSESSTMPDDDIDGLQGTSSSDVNDDDSESHRVARQIAMPAAHGDLAPGYENTTGNDEIMLSNNVLNTWKHIEAEISIGDLYQATNHKLDDFIFSCKWKNKPCDMSWFTPEVTDLGMCHTFNFNVTDTMTTDLTGSFNGLSLVLNVEKYDHTTGVNSDAGIKLHLRDQSDVPSVSDTGIAIALSTHTLIEMRYTKTKSLGDPHGDCGDISLDYYPDKKYTYARCQRQCRSKQLEAQCRCRDAYMPDTSGEPVCSVYKYLHCVLGFYTRNNTETPYECEKCPDACEVVDFATEMSFASLSELSALELINDQSKQGVLQKRFYAARESMARSNPTYIVSTINQLEHVIHQLQQTLEYTTNNAPTSKVSFSSFAIKAVSTIVTLFQKDVGKTLTGQITGILSDYDISYGMAVDDLIEETNRLSRMMSSVANTLMERVGKAPEGVSISSNVVKTLMNKINDADPIIKFRRNILSNVPRRLYKGPKEQEKSELAMKHLVQEISAFIDLLNNITSPLSKNITRAEVASIVKKHKEFTTASIKVEESMLSYGLMLEEVSLWLRTDNYANGRITQITSELETTLNVELLKKDLEIQLAALQDLYNRYALNVIDHHELTTHINNGLSQRMDSFLEVFQEGLLDKYLGRMSTAVERINIEVVEAYSKVLEYLTRLHVHFEPQSGNTFEDDARSMDIWRMPYTRRNAIESLLFRYRQNQSYIRWPRSRDLTSFTTNNGSRTVLKFIMSHYFESVGTQFADFEATIKVYMKALKVDIKQLVQNMNDFRLSSIIDPKFVVENFLKLDVYYGELKYEFIEQTPSYDLIDFFSDMGGYMGLLLGASLMTVCEIFDLFLYQSIVKVIAAGKRARKISSARSRDSVEAWPEKK